MLSVVLLTGCSNTNGRHQHYGDVDHEHAVNIAKGMLGVPYLYGGETPETGFDCSGLVVYSYQQVGITLPRTTFDQYKSTLPIGKHRIRPGDLLFFRISRVRISHVGIYLGGNRFIHAPSTGKVVSIARLDNPYWLKRFIAARRITGRKHF
ncbi:MAG: C40 family peptidase [Gammaproteobacteria bacterium]|nr:C40 family peptidase [Gammaproteobacteria bacterium]MDH5652788.1 C40 family peptidase [Gammaproteobacteria bacterium]